MVKSQVSPGNKGILDEIRAPVPLIFCVSPSMSPREVLIVTAYLTLNLSWPRLS
jgi:hypothetical protein